MQLAHGKGRSTGDRQAYQVRWLGINNELVLLEILYARSYVSMSFIRWRGWQQSATGTYLESKLHGYDRAACALQRCLSVDRCRILLSGFFKATMKLQGGRVGDGKGRSMLRFMYGWPERHQLAKLRRQRLPRSCQPLSPLVASFSTTIFGNHLRIGFRTSKEDISTIEQTQLKILSLCFEH